MTRQHAASVLATALVVGVLASIPTEVQSIGVCYGVNGDVLPSANEVVEIYKSNGITGMRIYEPRADILAALAGTNIALIMDVPFGELAKLASDLDAATSWVKDNVLAYPNVNIQYIAVGNEVNGSLPEALHILPAMKYINAALSTAGLNSIRVSTAVQSGVTTGYPPSHGTFSDLLGSHMAPIAQYLASTGAPLLANIYPYFAYTGSTEIQLDYALFKAQGMVVQDNGNQYQNLFDAMVDTFYYALESAGAGKVGIVVSESGWPSDGGTAATLDNAGTYVQNLVKHVSKGTPKMPQPLETYIFAMFNENLKPGAETEKHFGLFNPNMLPVYHIDFSEN